MKRKRIIIIFCVILLLAAAGFFAFQYFQSQQSAIPANLQTVAIGRGELTAVVGATGSVYANQSAVLGWQTTGLIQKINVNVGDVVKAGEKLAELDPSSLPQNVIVSQAEYIANKRSLDNLLKSDLSKTQAYQTMVAAQDELENAKKDRINLDFQYGNQNTVDAARAEYILAQEKVKDEEEAYSRTEYLLEDDPARANALSRLANARNARDKALAKLNWALSRADELDLAKADARIEVAQSKLDDAKREWERLKDGPDPQDIQAARAKVAASEASLRLAYIEAPFSGTITLVNSKTGDRVNTTTNTFRIDDFSSLLVDLEVTEMDINRIKPQQDAILTFDAIDGKEYEGFVSEVSRVGVITDGVVKFSVTIKLSNADEKVRPGMTAAAKIVVDKVENVLLVPNRAVRSLEGKRVVYILRGNKQEPVDIKIGLSSESESELLDGEIKEGELVILNPTIQMRPGMGGPPGGGGSR